MLEALYLALLWRGIGKKSSLTTKDGIDMNNINISLWWSQRGAHERMIMVCLGAYLTQTLLPFLFSFSEGGLLEWFSLPGSFNSFIFKPWTLISYAFFHASLSHLFWNMVMLYFGGQFFLNLFSSQRFYNVFFLGLIVGGLIFLLSYTVFPVFSGNGSNLVGASAGVTAIFIFICAYMPYQEVRIFFFNVKLWQLGIFFILTDLIQIPNGNAGGHLAHIGGGLLGFIYARKLKEGIDIGIGFETYWNVLVRTLSFKSKPLRTAYRAKKNSNSEAPNTQAYQNRERQKKIDTILDKISHSGYDSLSKEEKDYLFKSGKS
jgi:membrane associated rhomboid family serine protease